MVRYARRSTYRRKGRRGNRSLSTRRIFNNKSAKAQAKQIYALRKSINYVRKQCKPEVKVLYTSTSNRGFSLGTGGVVDPQIIPMPNVVVGTNDAQRIGNVIHILPLKINTALFYETVINSRLGYPPFSELREHGGQLRFVAIQAKSSMDEAPTAEDIFKVVNVASDIDTSMMMRMPFKPGITAKYYILKNTVFTLSTSKPSLSTNIKVYPKIKTVQWEDNVTYPKGHIWLIWIGAGMVRRTSEEGESTVEDYNSISTTWRMELPYTDA